MLKLLFALLSHAPLVLLHAVGAALGCLVWLLSSTYRRRFSENSRQAGYAFSAVRSAIAHAGRMSMELPRLWLGPTPPLQWRGEDHVRAAYESGRGVLVLTPHMGCFEIVAQALAARFGASHAPITVLYRPSRQPALQEVMVGSRARQHLHTAPTTLAGVRQMLRALKQGQAVGLLPDQVPPEGMGLWIDTFGKPAYTMTLAARLAQQSGATLVLAWGERLSWGRGYRVHFFPFKQSLSTDLAEATLQINQAIEGVIRACPSQYLWGYARYKEPRPQDILSTPAPTQAQEGKHS